MRTSTLFNEGWSFCKEGETSPVTLPHTWNAQDGQGSADYYRGCCSYEKTFAAPKLLANQRLYLEFAGVNSGAKVLPLRCRP